jgi:hypothetical protein
LTTIRSSSTTLLPPSPNTMQIDSLTKYQDILKLFTEILLLTFVNPEISLAQFRAILRIHFDSILQVTSLLFSSHSSSVGLDLLILCTLSPILHNLRCLSKISKTKKMNSKLILKFQAMDDDLSSLLEVFQKLFSLQTISSSLFQTDLKSSFPRPEDSIVTSLYHQFSTLGSIAMQSLVTDGWPCPPSWISSLNSRHLSSQQRHHNSNNSSDCNKDMNLWIPLLFNFFKMELKILTIALMIPFLKS